MQRSADGYNPCPPFVRETIASQIVPAVRRGTLIDTCAGDGGAATDLARAWNLAPFFIELDPDRARQCARRGAGPVAVGSAEYAQLEGHPSVWYFNPPWDPADPDGYLEHELFRASSLYALSQDTLAVMLFPARCLDMPELWGDLTRRLDRLEVRAFPQPYFGTFGQLVLFGYGRSASAPAPQIRSADLRPLVPSELSYDVLEQAEPLRSVTMRGQRNAASLARPLPSSAKRRMPNDRGRFP